MVFTTKITAQKWMTFLEMVNENTPLPDEDHYICPQVIMYQTRATKDSFVNRIKEDVESSIEKGQLSRARETTKIEYWSKGLTIGGFLPLIKSQGTVAVFTNALGNAADLSKPGVFSWHTNAIVYQHGVLAIYDPSFIPETSNLTSCTRVALLKVLIKAFRAGRAGHKLSEIQFSGGGNDGKHCQEMTRQWLEDEFITKGGQELGNWYNREG